MPVEMPRESDGSIREPECVGATDDPCRIASTPKTGQTETRPAMRRIVVALGVIVGIFLIVRAVVELFTIDYSDPSSYADDWGGPSLARVLLVHCGLGLIAAIWIGVLLWRRSSRSSASER